MATKGMRISVTVRKYKVPVKFGPHAQEEYIVPALSAIGRGINSYHKPAAARFRNSRPKTVSFKKMHLFKALLRQAAMASAP